jgi:SAM-dependent methyltransferase
MGIERPITLTVQDMFAAGRPANRSDQFDSIVISEVIEHLEDPLAALKALYEWTAPGGHIWVHVPANSPAPDHLYLIRDPLEADELVKQAGFEVVDSAYFPMSGITLERARKHALTVSCTVTGRRPD